MMGDPLLLPTSYSSYLLSFSLLFLYLPTLQNTSVFLLTVSSPYSRCPFSYSGAATWGVPLPYRSLSRTDDYRRTTPAFCQKLAALSLAAPLTRLLPPLETPLAVQCDRVAGWGPSEAPSIHVDYFHVVVCGSPTSPRTLCCCYPTSCKDSR